MPPPTPHERWLEALRRDLDQRREQHLYRELTTLESTTGTTVRVAGKDYLQFCSNNYLGLANDPEVIAAARETAGKYGAGAGASRLVSGTTEIHHELETALARFKGTEAALVFPAGFMANLAVLTTFAGSGDLIVSDKLNHASLLDGAKFSGAECRTFPHRKYGRADELLSKVDNRNGKFLVTDSVFSMDGNLADLSTCCDVAEKNYALVIIDEAHATGVLGPLGHGVAELQNVEHRIAITVGTLSKALGSLGGFVAGKREVIDTLINAARPFIYTTAASPADCGAALAALRIIEREPQRRHRVMQFAQHVKRELTAMGFNCGEPGDAQSPIIPVLLGESETALRAAAQLKENGIWVSAIRPPTVPPGSARLRISLMATHTDAHIEQLLAAMRPLAPSSPK